MAGAQTGIAQREEIDLREFIGVIRRHWWILLVCGLVGALAGVGVTVAQTRTWEATASGMVVAKGSSDVAEAFAGDNLARSKATTYESLATTRPIAELVIKDLRLDTEPAQLVSRINAQVPVDTSEVQITAQGPTPEAARELADAWVEALASRVETLETTADVAVGPGSVDPLLRIVPAAPALEPTEPASPNMSLLVSAGALFGVLVGLGVVLGRHRMTR